MTRFGDESAAAARGRGVMHASVAGALFQGVYALSQFVILAALLRHVGVERFGMWTTIWSIGIWALLANLGIHHAILTQVGQIATTDRERAGKVLGTSLVLVAGVSVGLIVLALVIVPMLPWPAILNVQGDQAVAEASSVTLAALVMVLLGLPASLGGAALLASQRGRSAYVAATVAHISCAATVAVGVWLGWPLLWLVVVVMSPPLLAGALQWLMLLTGSHAVPLGKFNRREAEGLLRIGFGFLVLELFTIGLMQTGSIIIAQTHGAAAVTPYAAMYRLIGLVQAVYLAVVFAYWPAFGEAAHRGDHQWFDRALRWSFAKTIGVWFASALGIYLLGDWFIQWWLGSEAMPTTSLKVWMIAFVGLHGLLLWVTTPLKGVGRLGSQLIGGAVMMVLFIPLAVWLCVRYGAAGVPMAQAGVILLVGLPINFVSIRRVTRWPTL